MTEGLLDPILPPGAAKKRVARSLMPDYLRLIALFGIVVVNIQFIAFSAVGSFAEPGRETGLDRLTLLLVNGLAAVKSGMIDNAQHPFWRRARRLCLVPGVAISLIGAAIWQWGPPELGLAITIAAAPVATLGYLGVILSSLAHRDLSWHGRDRRRVRALSSCPVCREISACIYC